MRTWNPLGEMDRLRQEMNRVLDGFGRRRPSSRSVFLPGLSARTYPRINIHDDKEKLVVEALAPGLNTDVLDVSIKGSTLTLAGEKLALKGIKREAFHRSERSTGRFVRTVELNSEIDSAGVTAEYQDGILTVTLPKSERALPKQIAVNVK